MLPCVFQRSTQMERPLPLQSGDGCHCVLGPSRAARPKTNSENGTRADFNKEQKSQRGLLDLASRQLTPA